MNLWKEDHNKLKTILEKSGWRCVKNITSGLERDWHRQY